FPDEPSLLLNYARALFSNGKPGQAILTLNRAKAQSAELTDEANQLLKAISDAEAGFTAGDQPEKLADQLGLGTCVIIDGDDAVRMQLEEVLTELGVSFIKTFSDGQEAWNWLKVNDEPNLILQE